MLISIVVFTVNKQPFFFSKERYFETNPAARVASGKGKRATAADENKKKGGRWGDKGPTQLVFFFVLESSKTSFLSLFSISLSLLSLFALFHRTGKKRTNNAQARIACVQKATTADKKIYLSRALMASSESSCICCSCLAGS